MHATSKKIWASLGLCILLSACAETHETTQMDMNASATIHAKAAAEPNEQTSPEIIQPEPLLQDLNESDIAISQAMAKRDYLQHWPVIAERSRYVRKRIVQTIEKLNAPPSLQAIPIVESGYNSYALSHAGAMGLWQLMPRTARGLGVIRTKHINGRRGVEQATEAAIKYLLEMHHRFNSWPLAIAAYHMGPYGLARRLSKTPWQAGDGLDAMPAPAITRAYVKHIIGLAALMHFHTIDFPEPYETTALLVSPPVDLIRISESCCMSKNDIFLFNPGLNQAQYLRQPIMLHIPKQHLISFQQQIERSAPKYVSTSVRPGDSLWSIAHLHHIQVGRLKSLNPGIGNLLRPGQQIKVPANQLARATAQPNPLLSKGRRIRYKVRSGDSLWSIAQRFGTSARAIARSNQLSQTALIRPGDTLWILARIRPS